LNDPLKVIRGQGNCGFRILGIKFLSVGTFLTVSALWMQTQFVYDDDNDDDRHALYICWWRTPDSVTLKLSFRMTFTWVSADADDAGWLIVEHYQKPFTSVPKAVETLPEPDCQNQATAMTLTWFSQGRPTTLHPLSICFTATKSRKNILSFLMPTSNMLSVQSSCQ